MGRCGGRLVVPGGVSGIGLGSGFGDGWRRRERKARFARRALVVRHGEVRGTEGFGGIGSGFCVRRKMGDEAGLTRVAFDGRGRWFGILRRLRLRMQRFGRLFDGSGGVQLGGEGANGAGVPDR